MDWIPNFFRRRKLYDDLSKEMRLHIEERAEQLMGEGMSRKEAERQARMAFGNRAVLEERSREVWQWPRLESIWADVRIAARTLRRSPAFTIAAVVTLALAIGANAVVFGVLNALILRPLNVPDAQGLYTIERGANKEQATSYPDYLDLRDRNRSFDGLTAYILTQVALDTGKDPSEVWGYEVTGNYFDAMKIQPYLGRFFHVADDHGPNSAPYLVLTYAYWHSHFQDDRGVVGRVVQVNKHPYAVLGVTPPEFRGTLVFFYPDFFVPMVNREDGPSFLSIGTVIEIAGNWFCGRTAPWNPGLPGACIHCLHSYAARPAGPGRGCAGHAFAGPFGYMDPSSAGTVDRSHDAAARRLNRLICRNSCGLI